MDAGNLIKPALARGELKCVGAGCGGKSGARNHAEPILNPIYVHSDKRIEAMLLVNMLALLVYRLLEREMHNKGLQMTTRRLIEQLEDLAVIETQCWDGSVLCRLTPASEEQRRLISFLAAIVTELLLCQRASPSCPTRQWQHYPRRGSHS